MKKKYPIQNILVIAILIIVAANTVFIGRLTSVMSVSITQALEISRPAKLSAVIIKADDCDNCFDIDSVLEGIKNTNVLIESETQLNLSDKKAAQLLSSYGITKLPTIVLTGEIKKDPQIEKAWENIGEIRNDAVIFTKQTPPYFSITENRIAGEVTVTYLNDDSCTNCFSYKSFISQLKNSGVVITEEKSFDYHTAEGRRLIQDYQIQNVPTFIINSELALYENITKNWAQYGNIAADGSYVAAQTNPPYRNLATGGIKGLIGLTNLIDPSCNECFQISSLTKLLNQFGLVYGSNRTVTIDSAEGRALISKYNITKVPTILLDSEADSYISLKRVWAQVGTIESDKTFVARNLEVVRGVKYKDLTTNTIISK